MNQSWPAVSRSCGDCTASFQAASSSKARFCPCCRSRRQAHQLVKYVWTPELDAMLRSRYDSTKGGAETIARGLSWPVWVVKRRAAVLGVTRPRFGAGREWTAAEQSFLEEHAGSRTVLWISRRLKRTVWSVVKKLQGLGISLAVHDGYTSRGLALCFGVHVGVIERWAERGMLKVGRRRETRTGTPGRVWATAEAEVLRFIRDNPTAFDLRRVDQTWFLDLIFHSTARKKQRSYTTSCAATESCSYPREAAHA